MPLSKSSKIRVGITIGDPSSIGPIITLKAIQRLKGRADFVVIGDRWVIEQVTSKSQIPNFNIVDLKNVKHQNFKFGKVKAEYGRASIEYLDKALELIEKKEIDCLVTCPVSKESVSKNYPDFSGHTEYLSKQAQVKDFVMMLLNKKLKMSLVTRHLPLKNVPGQLNKDNLDKTISLTHKALRQLFLIKNPRLVVCGLNPHASDNGLLGKEENKIIKPVLNKLRTKFKYLDGPVSSDMAIYKASRQEYDAVIVMYHDQALIPLKLLDRQTGVNITLGLPYVRTSPLHGTAFDIAGNYKLASPASLIQAIKIAIRCTLNLKKD